MKKIAVHYTAHYLINPTNPVSINLIGVGGTGSQVLLNLAKIDGALRARNHPGLLVRAFDSDKVSPSNIIRQRFSEAEIGQLKSVAMINKINRGLGLNWKAIPLNYNKKNRREIGNKISANITLSCIDIISGRFEIADILNQTKKQYNYSRDKPFYWLDFGNSQYSGQVILSTVGTHSQPKSKKFITASKLPFITDEFRETFQDQKDTEKNTPSCSLAEALNQQDLFINPAIANTGCSLLWNLITHGLTTTRGVFMDVSTHRSQPLPINGD